jgi:long-chain fatty acid transport protein
MRRIAVLSAATLLTAIILAPRAEAQGFAVYEHDACTMARGAAGVAAPCAGGSAVFFNPAGIIGSGTRFNIEGNLTLIAPTGNYTDSASRVKTDLNKHTFPVPGGYATYQLGRGFAAGIGVYAPYGLTTDWPTTSPGRFLAYKTSIASIYVQPTIAYTLTKGIQIGGGPIWVHSSAQVHRHLDASANPIPGVPGATLAMLGVPVGTDFADVLFDVSGTGWGYHLGVMLQATDRLSFGARYLSQVKINYTGTASFTQIQTGLTVPAGNALGLPGGTPFDAVLASAFLPDSLLSNQSASTSITMPWQVVAGVAYKLLDNLTVLADWQHTAWSSFQTLALTLQRAPAVASAESYTNTDAFRVGLDWQATSGLAIRLGALRHNGASPDQSVTPLLPEGNRVEGTVGVGIKLLPQLRLDLAYQYLQQQDRRGRVIDPPAGVAPTPAMNTGLYSFKANLFGASLALGF